jgi:hypothetical protein
MSAVPSGLSVPARGFFDVAPTRHAKSLAILGNPAEFDAKSLAGTLIATDDVPCMQVLTTALSDGSLPEGGTLIATDDLPCMQVPTAAPFPHRSYGDCILL